MQAWWRYMKKFLQICTHRISSYSFRGNYSFLNLEIQRSQYIKPKVTVHKCGETIQGRKLFKGGNYMRKYGSKFDFVIRLTIFQIQKTPHLIFYSNPLTDTIYVWVHWRFVRYLLTQGKNAVRHPSPRLSGFNFANLTSQLVEIVYI